MTHTAEPMTLKRMHDVMAVYISPTTNWVKGLSTGLLKQWIATVDAELAKQSEAKPVAHDPDCNLNMSDIGQRIKGCDCSHPRQRNAVDARSESDDAEEIAQWLHTRGHHKAAQTIRTQLDVRNARIRELEQRNVVKVTDENMVQAVAWAIAEADGCEPEQLIWEGNPPEPWGIVANKYEKHARAAISTVASRDREDAE